MTDPNVGREEARRAWFARWDLWFRPLGWGGAATPKEVERHMLDGDVLNEREHQILMQALDERAAEQHRCGSVPQNRPPCS